MRLVIQRVTYGAVTVAGKTVASTGKGLVALVGFCTGDNRAASAYMARKLVSLRLWPQLQAQTQTPTQNDAAAASTNAVVDSSTPAEGKPWSCSAAQLGLDVLLVSQFTLHAVLKGNKPDYHLAMETEQAKALYEEFVHMVREEYDKARPKDKGQKTKNDSVDAPDPVSAPSASTPSSISSSSSIPAAAATSSPVPAPSGRIASGIFGADMCVSLANDGPVTILLDTDGMDFKSVLTKEEKMEQYKKKQQAIREKKLQEQQQQSGQQQGQGQQEKKSKGGQRQRDGNHANNRSHKSGGNQQQEGSGPGDGKQQQQGGGEGDRSSSSASNGASTAAAAVATVTSCAVSASPSKEEGDNDEAAKQKTDWNGSGKTRKPVTAAQVSPAPSDSSISKHSTASTHDPSTSTPLPPLPPGVSPSFSSLVGHTPLLFLRSPSIATGCLILGKAEFLNAGGSIKDRPALSIIQRAEHIGILKRGKPGWIVEGTAGNTGIGLALVGAERGYQTIVVMAENNSQEKKDALRAVGALVVEVPAVPFSNPNNYVHVAARMAEILRKKLKAENGDEEPHVLLADQWSNEANREAHFQTTGPEIWRQVNGNEHEHGHDGSADAKAKMASSSDSRPSMKNRISAFCAGAGTGGSLSGVGSYLLSMDASIRIILVDPSGSALKSYFERGCLEVSAGKSVAEGIGQGRLCDNLVRGGFRPDECIHVSDNEALKVAQQMLAQDGIFVGGSSAVNVAGAMQVARKLGPGHVIVTLLADGGQRYTSKLSNVSFLSSNSLPIPPWLDPTIKQTMDHQQMIQQLKKNALVDVDANTDNVVS